MTDDQIYYDAVDLLKQLIAVPSISRDEKVAADCVEDFARHMMPGQTRRINNNIMVTAPLFDPARTTLLLNSHIDTVKPALNWSRDPFEPSVDELSQKLYGLGSNDAGASLVSLMAAFRAIAPVQRSYNLIFVASAEEEVSGKNGLSAVLPFLPEIKVAIVGEPTAMRPAIAEKGLMVLDGVSTGISGHAARNEGVNALYKAVEAIDRLRKLEIQPVSKTLGQVKISVTQIEAGKQHNVIPDHCSFVVDVRTTDTNSNLETLEIIRREVGDLATLTPRSTRLNPSSIDPAHPIVTRLAMLGLEPFGSPTLSDQALMPWPSVKVGPGDSARSHTADEFIYLNEIREAIEIYTKILHNLDI